VLPGLGN